MKLNISSAIEYRRIKIYINNILHISLPKDNNIKIQSWKEDESLFKIEIWCCGHLDEYHYAKIEIWKRVLEELDNRIK